MWKDTQRVRPGVKPFRGSHSGCAWQTWCRRACTDAMTTRVTLYERGQTPDRRTQLNWHVNNKLAAAMLAQGFPFWRSGAVAHGTWEDGLVFYGSSRLRQRSALPARGR